MDIKKLKDQKPGHLDYMRISSILDIPIYLIQKEYDTWFDLCLYERENVIINFEEYLSKLYLKNIKKTP